VVDEFSTKSEQDLQSVDLALLGGARRQREALPRLLMRSLGVAASRTLSLSVSAKLAARRLRVSSAMQVTVQITLDAEQGRGRPGEGRGGRTEGR
jgi:hypothetical protein